MGAGVAVDEGAYLHEPCTHLCPIIGQAQGFAEASEGVSDPSALQQLMAKFPAVADVVASVSDPSTFAATIHSAVTSAMAEAFAATYWVSAFLCLTTLAVAAFLPRKREESHLLDQEPRESAPVGLQ